MKTILNHALKTLLLGFFILPLFLYCEETKQKLDSKKFDLLTGKVDYSSHNNFVKVPVKFASRPGMYLHTQTLQAFEKMHKAAQTDRIDLKIISAGRNFFDQKRIWERKWQGQALVEGKKLNLEVPDPNKRALFILRFSSMPGTSRHHWGTDMDLNALNNHYFRSGSGKKVYQWLQKHAGSFGFCQPYTSKNSGRTGYEEEMWHWSYKPLSGPYLNEYQKNIHNRDITGFAGSQTAIKIDIVENYVLGVSADCK